MAQLKLPQEWLQIQLGDVASYGKTQKCELSDVTDDTWVLELEDIEKDSSRIISRKTARERPFKSTKNRFERGNVLYGKLRPYLNKVVVADTDGVCTTEIIPLDSEPFVLNRYLFHWLKTRDFLNYVNDVSYGVNMPRLGIKDGVAAPFILAPLAEQKVIANKLDTLLAQVENTKARLKRIPQILKRFRQSVLAAAVSGRLTEELKPWESKKLDECFECIDGDRGPNYPKKHEYLDSGYCLFLSTKNVRPFGFDFTDQVFISKEKDEVLRKGRLTRGDLVITTRGTLGHIASFDESAPFDVVRINSGMLILRKKQPDYSNDYFKILIASPLFRKYINDQSTGSAQPQLPSKILKGFILPVPSPEEQTEIVNQVDQLFAHADRIEQQVNNALARVNNLTQSILAKAFRGELTEQWRKDNPELISGENSAEALPERIKAERAAVKPAKKARSTKTTV